MINESGLDKFMGKFNLRVLEYMAFLVALGEYNLEGCWIERAKDIYKEMPLQDSWERIALAASGSERLFRDIIDIEAHQVARQILNKVEE